ncbi:B-type cyclin [Coemansia sp. RSA 2611]|nr:B-type cyclin [Coemansia sp. RSA 2610]KAJ2391925.1 B-type cyclin [Coemansia sp. RSA 2611]
MAHRSRIPVRRGVTDENKVGAATARPGKDTEPVKAVGRARVPAATATAASKNAIKPAGAAKTFGAPTTRSRSALGEIGNVKAQVTKLTKPGEVAAKIQAKPLAKNVRANVASGISKPAAAAAGVRGRQPISARPTAAGLVRPSAAVLGTRPISKPAANFGARRTRPAASAAPAANTATKRARAAAAATTAAAPAATSSVLGKHSRSGGVVRTARAEAVSAHPAPAAGSPACDSGADSDDLASTAVSSSVASLKLSSPSLGDLKFVEVDTIDYALEHTGTRGEQPILMREIDAFEADVDPADMTLVPEFSDDIFGYMRELEVRLMADATYIERQPALTWATRSILVEWLVQVHQRFNLLPETLYLCVNFVDRFLSCKEIMINKLQLVGAVCLLLASKYEEMHVPSIKDLEYMVEKNYSEDEILRAERFILRMLNFDLGHPSPLSFLRRISKADDYDMATRTLAKYLIEVTLIDERFISVPCSKVAAAAHYLSLRLLQKGPWTRAHAFYAGYFESELLPHATVLLELLMQPRKHRAIFEKYADRRFLRASEFVYQWLKNNQPEELLVPTGDDLKPEPEGQHADKSVF